MLDVQNSTFCYRTHYWPQDSIGQALSWAALHGTPETPASGTGGYRLQSNEQEFAMFIHKTDTPYSLLRRVK